MVATGSIACYMLSSSVVFGPHAGTPTARCSPNITMNLLLDSLTKDNSARREKRSFLPADFDAENDDAPLLDPLSKAQLDVWNDDECVLGRDSPEASLLQPSLFLNEDSAFSSISPTSTAVNLGLSRVHSQKSNALSSPPLEEIDLLQLIEKSLWKKLKRAIDALSHSSGESVDAIVSKKNSRGETPVHMLAWKAPTELLLTALELPSVLAQLTVVDRDDNTPLHLACANITDRSEFPVLKAMSALAPEALTLQNDHGDTPLHLLVSSPAFIRSQDFLMEAEAAASVAQFLSQTSNALQVNNDDATLLHISLAVGAHERVILQLLETVSEAARLPDHFGYLPVHYVAAFAAFQGTPWPVVAKLIRAFPESISAQTGDGDTPLHLLMSNANKFLKRDSEFLDRNTTKIAELLMGMEETSIDNSAPLLVVNKSEMNPLHVSACFESPPQLVRILMESKHGMAAACATTSFGSTPLHLACSGKKSSKCKSLGKNKSSKRLLSIVEALATPAVCAVRDSLGRTPLMVAVQYKKMNKKVIRALLQVYPQAAEQRTSNGYLPLHLAVQSKYASDSIVKTLLQEYPQSVFETNNKGDTPLHEACLCSKIPYDVVELLVRKNPAAVDCENSNHELPIDRARAMGVSKKICTLLMETAKSLKEKENKKSKPESTPPKVPEKAVSFFVPQLREPAGNRRDAPDPPADLQPCSPRSERSADPTPMRQRGGTPDNLVPLLGERTGSASEGKGDTGKSRKVEKVVLSDLKGSVRSQRSQTSLKVREGRSADKKQPAKKRSTSVSNVSESRGSGRADRLRSHTRSPPRGELRDHSVLLPKPLLERRARSESHMQPKIARKKQNSVSSIGTKQNEVYRFEI